jgi:hypothetical protein
MKAFPQFIPFQSNFDIAFPTPEDKTYEAYVDFITPHLSAISAQSSSNPFAGSMTPAATTSQQKTLDALTAKINSLTSALAAVTTNPTSQLPLPSSPPTSLPLPTKYCFVHGLNFSHVGKQCKVMLSSPHLHPASHLNASCPADSPGGNTNTQVSRVLTPPPPSPPTSHFNSSPATY